MFVSVASAMVDTHKNCLEVLLLIFQVNRTNCPDSQVLIGQNKIWLYTYNYYNCTKKNLKLIVKGSQTQSVIVELSASGSDSSQLSQSSRNHENSSPVTAVALAVLVGKVSDRVTWRVLSPHHSWMILSLFHLSREGGPSILMWSRLSSRSCFRHDLLSDLVSFSWEKQRSLVFPLSLYQYGTEIWQ